MKLLKKADFELDQLGKLILAGILLVVLIVVVSIYLGAEFNLQADRLEAIFNIF